MRVKHVTVKKSHVARADEKLRNEFRRFEEELDERELHHRKMLRSFFDILIFASMAFIFYTIW